MKKQTIFRIFSVTLTLLLLGSVAMAQYTLTAEEKERADRENEMKEQQLKSIELALDYAEQARESARARSSARVYSYSSGSSDEKPYVFFSGGQESKSQLTIRNSYRGTSDTSKGEFDVNESTTHIRCMINGKVRSGKITIKVLYPGGKVFKNLSITSSAEISFTQSLSIKEEEKKKYIGSWNYEVTADKAEGSYMLSFMTQ